jgi:integrase
MGGSSSRTFLAAVAVEVERSRKLFRRACAKVGLDHLWFHDLRRSFVTNARRRGVGVGGHEDVGSPDPERLRPLQHRRGRGREERSESDRGRKDPRAR